MDQKMVLVGMEDQQIDLPPGFRFHPTDEELITHYLCKKIGDGSFTSLAIGEADLNKCEPWDLPAKAKMGEDEWYFFCLRDKKYPTGQRTNRATESGYWKATGKDKEILRGKSLIGMKKTLVFYRGRAPKGEKSNWVMHEYRLEGKLSLHNLPLTVNTEWVISRVFEKKMHIPSVPDLSSFMVQTQLPPLMDLSQSDAKFKNIITTSPSPNVSCFSSIDSYNNSQLLEIHQNPFSGFGQSKSSMFIPGNYDFSASKTAPDNAMASAYLNNNFWPSGSVSPETGLATDVNEIPSSVMEMSWRPFEEGSASGAGPVDHECMWPHQKQSKQSRGGSQFQLTE